MDNITFANISCHLYFLHKMDLLHNEKTVYINVFICDVIKNNMMDTILIWNNYIYRHGAITYFYKGLIYGKIYDSYFVNFSLNKTYILNGYIFGNLY